jgi:hypothetical protein
MPTVHCVVIAYFSRAFREKGPALVEEGDVEENAHIQTVSEPWYLKEIVPRHDGLSRPEEVLVSPRGNVPTPDPISGTAPVDKAGPELLPPHCHPPEKRLARVEPAVALPENEVITP